MDLVQQGQRRDSPHADPRSSGGAGRDAFGTPKTPQEAAQEVLKAIEPTTTVTTDSAVEVAGRPAYELVLDPNESDTLITQARLAIDGDTKLPLAFRCSGLITRSFSRWATPPSTSLGPMTPSSSSIHRRSQGHRGTVK
jgi:hypothetical protein